jgi:hypothetical protein
MKRTLSWLGRVVPAIVILTMLLGLIGVPTAS